MKALKYLLQKEFLQFRRNKFLPRLIVMFPVMMICVAPLIADLEVRNISVVAVDNDHSQASQSLIRQIEASRYFLFNGTTDTYASALHEIEKCNADVVIEIPRGFSRQLVLDNSPQVLIAANAVNGTKGSLGTAYLSQIVTTAAATPRVQTLSPAITTLNLYNPRQNYKLFMIPAFMAIAMVIMGGFLPALNIVSEKELGTIEQINVTPVGKVQFILAKLIPYWLIGMFVVTLCLLLSWVTWGIVPRGNLLLIYLLCMLLALIFSGIGLLISNVSDTMQQAMFVMWFFVVCFMLMSGLFTPISSMPDWAQRLTIINPLRYFITAIRSVFIRGATLPTIANETLILSSFALLTFLLSLLTYRKNH